MSKAVGCCRLEVFDRQKGISFPMLVMFPTDTVSSPVQFGPYTLDVSLDAKIAPGNFHGCSYEAFTKELNVEVRAFLVQASTLTRKTT